MYHKRCKKNSLIFTEPERLTSQEQQELSAEEALAAEEEAFSLLAQQQSQDLTYITVPAIASQQAQVFTITIKQLFLAF